MFLVEQDGNQDHVKIVDFGIALKARAPISQPSLSTTAGQTRQSFPAIGKDNNRYTMAGMVMGTPHYMSPEQIEGGDIDARSDQYALGCILYELLTGTVPFDAAEPQAILMQHLTVEVTSLRDRYPQGQAPASLQAVVLRMLAKDRAARFPSLREAAEALKGESEKLLGQTSSKVMLPKGKSSGLVIRGRRFSLWTAVPLATLLIGGVGYLGLRQLTRSERVEPLRADELRQVKQQALEVVALGLKEPSDEVRRSMVEGLGLTRDARQQPLVLPLLRDPSAAVQAQAATALGQLGDRTVTATLLTVARQSQAANVRTAAAAAAWQLGQSQGHELLVQALDSGDAAARQKAAFLLAEPGEPKAQSLLRQVLQSAELPEEVAVRLLGRLAQSGDGAARDKLRERLADPGRPAYLLAAARLLALGDEQALQGLRTRASSAFPDRLLAARLLSSADPEHSLPLLREVAQSGSADAPARLLAVSGLGLGGGIAEVRILRPLVQHEREPELQRGAALSVLQILARDPGALSEQGLLWARAALSDSDWVVRESAAVVLGDLKGAEAAALLSALTGDHEPRVRRSAMRALGRRDEHAATADPMVLAALHTGLQDTDLGVRQEALRALAKVARSLVQKGTPSILGELAGWLGGILSDGSPLEQALARAALLAAGDTSQQAKLRELLQSPSAEVRRAALESLEPDKELLASLLQDPAAGVRLLAARRLAELGDRRAVAVLKEAVSQGGATARMAQALLVRLGETPVPPPADSGNQDPVEQRLQAVDALAGLPVEQAVAQLLIAARDHDTSVRRRVATVAADLPGGGLPVLRFLLEDANPGVRALAAALLGRLQPAALPTAEKPAAAEPRAEGEHPPVTQPATQAAAVPDASTGEPAVPSPVEPTGEPATTSAAAQPGTIEEQAAQLTQSGVKLLQRHDFAKARQLFEKARHLCGRQKKSELCGSLQFDLSYHLAHVYEGQGYEAEAMGEYERLIKQSGRLPGKASELQEAQAGVIRLAPRLGVVMITRTSGGKCQEVTKWMPLGTHQIDVNGEKHEINVRADAPARVGSCP